MASLHRNVYRGALGIVTAVVAVAASPLAWSANGWDGGGMSNWWFDPSNWGQESPEPCPCLPPGQDNDAAVVRTDAQINVGTGDWDTTGEGVVFDPDSDPFFAAAANLNYPTGSAYAGSTYNMEYGPESIYRLYISRNTTNHNLMTIKSGELWIDSTTIIGRSGSTAEAQNEGRVVQTGGALMMPLSTMDIGNSEDSGWGNGVYDYQGGTMEISLDGGNGIRLAHGRDSGPSGINKFILRNPDSGGHVLTWDFNMISYRGSADGVFTEGEDPNGIDRGVAIVEFHFDNGGTRPMQVARNLTINNGLESSTGATLSSRLDLVLDEAPAVDGLGVPQNLGLFDVNFDYGFGNNGGIINGNGDISDAFASADGSTHYAEGDTMSVVFGNTRYDWTISYNGLINWANAADSVVDSITGTGTGDDVVLIGLGSEALPGLLGDFNNDGLVDLADYTVWRNNLGNADSVLPPGSTNDGSGVVDAGDYATWKQNFGNGSPAAVQAAAVPEPASWILLGLLGVAVVGCAPRR